MRIENQAAVAFDELVALLDVLEDVVAQAEEPAVDPDVGFGDSTEPGDQAGVVGLDRMEGLSGPDRHEARRHLAAPEVVDVTVQRQVAQAVGIVREECILALQVLAHAQQPLAEIPGDALDFANEQISRLTHGSGTENAAHIGEEMRHVMFDDVGVFRNHEGLERALAKIEELRERYKRVKVTDVSKMYNYDLIGAWELGNMLDLALITTQAALVRQESRGGHAREDFPKRDDANWMRHSLAWLEDDQVRLSYKPVVITKYPPKERTY